MPRPREFDEEAVLDAAANCFWARGYEATSVRDLIGETGITGASLYNAFGDKRALYHKALDHYVSRTVLDRIGRCEKLAPREAIGAFFSEIIGRSLRDRQHKGCMLVNAAVDVAPHDQEFQQIVAAILVRIEKFFLDRIEAGQADRSITRSIPAEDIARHFLGVLIGVRVLARVRPEPKLLRGVVASALTVLDARFDDVVEASTGA
jgi:TetR/AcrR family transcriptional repressor of nem operon